jgi:LysR family transcriptional regulator for bpeEF and oprC
MICASPSYLDKNGKPEHPEQLKQHRCLKFRNARTGRLYPWFFNEKGEVLQYLFNSAVEINDGDAIVNSAISGLGVGQMPGYLSKDGIANGQLIEVLSEFRPENVSFYAVYLDRRLLSPRIRVFIDFLVKWTKLNSVG